jgi:hypothetical protein
MTSDNDDLYWLLNQDRSAAGQARTLTWEALARLGLDVELIDDGVAIVSQMGTAAAAYRSLADLDGRAVWAVIPRRPRLLDDLEPGPAAHLLQRWLTRRGLRDVASRPDGCRRLVSVAGECVISCLPGKLAWRADGTDRIFPYRELPDVVDRVCRRSSEAGQQERRGAPISHCTGGG